MITEASVAGAARRELQGTTSSGAVAGVIARTWNATKPPTKSATSCVLPAPTCRKGSYTREYLYNF
eukprot:SAG22_NODE_698_length_7809_cov_2.743061_5_plen_66_part_00